MKRKNQCRLCYTNFLFVRGRYICSQVILVEFTGFHRFFFQIVLFRKILTFVPHTSWCRYQLRCYLAGPVVYQGWVRLSHHRLLCHYSSGRSSCLKCVIWAIKCTANAAVHCTSLTGHASHKFIIGIKIRLFRRTDVICISSVLDFPWWQCLILLRCIMRVDGHL